MTPPPQFWTNGLTTRAHAGSSSSTPRLSEWLRNIERHRRMLARKDAVPPKNTPFWVSYFVEATDASFRFDDMTIDPADLSAAVSRGWATKASPCSRQQQRIRNHVAILHQIERMLRKGIPLSVNSVVRWYTSIACGLSIERLDEPMSARLGEIIRQINSPHLRLEPAVQSIVRLHRQMLADPVVPSFSGILARLLLRYHLGRCGLPPVLFVPEHDAGAMNDECKLLGRMLERINETYALILLKPH
jgi:hypothetical protein